MNYILLSVVAPVIVSPALCFLSAKRRQMLMSLYVIGLLFLSMYLFTDLEVATYALFSFSDMPNGTGMELLSFSMHPYSRIAGFGFLFVGSIGLLYGLQIAKPVEQAISIIALASAVGVAFADNYITFLLLWEMLTLSTASLVLIKGTEHALKMAYRMLFMSLISGFLLTVGIVLHYNVAGSFALAYPAAGLSFFIVGIGVKAAFLPLYMWVPWGYPAASFPSSVLLAALCTKVGVYAVARILPPSEFLATMGACMAIFAVTMALLQSDLRKLLSFHIISQVGFMIAGVGLGIYLSVDGGMLHLVNHMIYKALLFMCAGALIYTVGTENLHDLHGHDHETETEAEERRLQVWKVLPIAFIGALAGALAISGVPPFNGYVSKYLLKNAVQGTNPVSWLLLVASVGTAISFTKFVYFGFIKATTKRIINPLTFTMKTAIIILAASCLITGAWPQILSSLLPYGSSLNVYSSSGIWMALQLAGLGIIIFFLISRLLEKEMPKLAIPLGIKIEVDNRSVDFLGNIQRGVNSMLQTVYTFGFKLFQSLDDKPDKRKDIKVVISISNMDFDVILIIGILALAFVVMFYLQFAGAFSL